MDDRFAVIMAGGSGKRFWPRSRAANPKQFLRLDDPEWSLLQASVRRILPLFPPDHIYVVTAQRHRARTAEQLPEIPPANILAEPIGRNTAPCIAWATAHVRRRAQRGVIAVLPADAHIEDEAAFRNTLQRAVDSARDNHLVAVGIVPTRPDTGYGYIEVADEPRGQAFAVARFVEKPDAETAQRFVATGRFLWNGGMFFFRADVMSRALAEHLPELARAMDQMDEAARRGTEEQLVAECYPKLPSISIDHGVMEKADNIVVVPGAFGWDDLGNWTAAWALAAKDDDGNAVTTDALVMDSRNCYVASTAGKLIAIVGADDLIVVDTEDALLIVRRDQAQRVGQVVEELARRQRDEFL